MTQSCSELLSSPCRFLCARYNFNHERWGVCVQAIRFARVCVEESMKHAFRRKTFGKKLIEHPVIRYKLAQMARQVEASHAWLEYISRYNTAR